MHVRCGEVELLHKFLPRTKRDGNKKLERCERTPPVIPKSGGASTRASKPLSVFCA